MNRTNSYFAALVAATLLPLGTPFAAEGASGVMPQPKEIKAYDLDFNWGPGGPNGFAKPGLWADADPTRHVAWYRALGANVIQTFCVSCNGYAWYKHSVVPEQPGLKHDFLPEVVKLAHKEGILVLGYFCAGSNTRWGQEHPDLSYGYPSEPHIPYTDEYLKYLNAAIRDAVGKTGIDGFMLDWLWMPTRSSTGGRWLDCEKKLYAQLMGEPFPGEQELPAAKLTEFGRRAVDRCWQTIRRAAKETNPHCIVWLTCNDVNNPQIADSRALRETDWLLNEAGDLQRTADARRMIGPQTRLITCLANWNGQDPTTIVPAAQKEGIGLYGFTKPGTDSLLPLDGILARPVDELNGDEKNIAVLGRAYHGVPLDSVRTSDGRFVEPRKAPPRAVERWQDWRFGLFIHWGPVSLTEKEISWSRANTNPKCPNNGPTPADVYDHLYERFNPTNFNAKAWVAVAKAAGMKYMVLTAKHCDGFLLWDSKASDYNIMHTPFHRDVCAELAQACHEAGMGIGWYFSPMDWKDPDCRTAKNAEFVKRMQAELTELLSNYGKIDVLWFDWDAGTVPWDQQDTYALVRRLQPDIVINNRLDCGQGGPFKDAANPASIGPWADFYTPEQFVGRFNNQQPWESCMTVSARNQWSWDGDTKHTKSFEQCLNMLIRCAGGDGNLLLDVGPMPDGEIAPVQVKLIGKMGGWLAQYGDSIYGKRGGPYKPGPFGVSTCKGHTVYLHILHWPGDKLELPDLPAKVVRSTALTGGSVTVAQSNGCLAVTLPAADHQKLDTVVALELDRDVKKIEPMSARFPSYSLAAGKPATASNVYHNDPRYSAAKAFDDDPETRWATDDGTTNAWLAVDLGKPETIGRAFIEQAYPEIMRVKKFVIETWQDGEWKPCYTGENLGATLNATFDPVVVQRVRLHITEATGGPTIWEFQLFPPAKQNGETK